MFVCIRAYESYRREPHRLTVMSARLRSACSFFLVLGFTSGQTEAVFQVIDRPFQTGSGLVNLVPFISSSRNAWIGTKIFLRINVNHSATGGRGTWVVTFTDSMIGSFVFHSGCGRGWNPVFIHRIVKVFKMCPGVQRNIGFLEVAASPKGITGKKFLVQADRIKILASDLSSSGEPDFLSMVISGLAAE